MTGIFRKQNGPLRFLSERPLFRSVEAGRARYGFEDTALTQAQALQL